MLFVWPMPRFNFPNSDKNGHKGQQSSIDFSPRSYKTLMPFTLYIFRRKRIRKCAHFVRFELILKIVSTGKGGGDSNWFLLLFPFATYHIKNEQQKIENGFNLPGKCCRKSNKMKIYFPSLQMKRIICVGFSHFVVVVTFHVCAPGFVSCDVM